MAKSNKSKAGAKPEVKSIIKTKASKEYRQLESKTAEQMDNWSKAMAKVRGQTPEEVKNEISAFFLDSLRKTDDLPTLAKVNLATLEMKEQIKLDTRYKILQRKYEKAQSQADEEGMDSALAQIEELMTNTDADYKKFKAINETAKLLHSMKDKVVTVRTQDQDDKMVFDIKDGVYTEE